MNHKDPMADETPPVDEVVTGKRTRSWLLWLCINLSVASYFLLGLFVPASSLKSAWLPGETTHGHYQIELDCNACHLSSDDESEHSADNLMQDACVRCHGDQLEMSKDTHPAKKFNDPTNAELLSVLDAQNCLTCHREHVPAQTGLMGLTVPQDYCWHCHDDVAESRPSHQGMAFNSCSTAGCHNYHDNRSLFEKYLNDHHGEPDLFEASVLPERNLPERNLLEQWMRSHPNSTALAVEDADGPTGENTSVKLLDDWQSTAHAAAGVNCSGCHQVPADEDANTESHWSDAVAMETCGRCHSRQKESFGLGKHGMRLASGMSPMTPEIARLPMHVDANHRQLTCNSCHPGHRFDTEYASTQACLGCHADSHSLAYEVSPHAELWTADASDRESAGTGVSCATCHLPRIREGSDVWVNHDQNANLRPNETMAREVCNTCHGLEYSLSALADPECVSGCFSQPPSDRIKSVEMAHEWFVDQDRKRSRRSRSRDKKRTDDSTKPTGPSA